MADETALSRLKVRLTTLSEVPADEELDEIVRGLSDRVCMRLRVRTLPDLAESVVVDAAVKVVRRRLYEGISSESEGQTGSVTTSFFEQVLAEYDADLAGIVDMLAAEGAASGAPTVRFL